MLDFFVELFNSFDFLLVDFVVMFCECDVVVDLDLINDCLVIFMFWFF